MVYALSTGALKYAFLLPLGTDVTMDLRSRKKGAAHIRSKHLWNGEEGVLRLALHGIGMYSQRKVRK